MLAESLLDVSRVKVDEDDDEGHPCWSPTPPWLDRDHVVMAAEEDDDDGLAECVWCDGRTKGEDMGY